MASMIFASSPLSAQSFVKLRTNSIYSHSPCYISRAKNSYIHLPCNNISHIDSSKSLFLKGESNISFSSPKFPRVASTNSPSLNIIKAYQYKESVYHFYARDVKIGKDISLGDIYKGKVLLMVNLTPQISIGPSYYLKQAAIVARILGRPLAHSVALKCSDDVKKEIMFLNYLYREYKDKASPAARGFEVLGFFPHKEEPKRHWWPCGSKEEKGNPNLEEEISKLANFPFFRKLYADDDKNPKNLWNFLTRDFKNYESQEFEKFLVDETGQPALYFPWFTGETVAESQKGTKPGEYLGEEYYIGKPIENPLLAVPDAIDGYFTPPLY